MRHRAIAVSVKKKVRKAVIGVREKERGRGDCSPHPLD
jgi:hypothetical protein